jgi:hypothetical protein
VDRVVTILHLAPRGRRRVYVIRMPGKSGGWSVNLTWPLLTCSCGRTRLVQGQTQCVDAAPVVGTAFKMLRSQVTEGAEQGPRAGKVRRPGGLGQAEVGDLEVDHFMA